MAKGYTTELLIEAETLFDISVSSEPTTSQVAQWIEEVEDEIDSITGTSFTSVIVTDAIIPFTHETAFNGSNNSYWYGRNRQDMPRELTNSFFLQDTAGGRQRRPIVSITSLSRNSSSSYGTEADDWTALTENTGSGGDYNIDNETGRVTILQCVPILGHPRGIKTTYNYGYSTIPEKVKTLATKMVAKRLLEAKATNSQVSSIDSISLEGISISKNISQTVPSSEDWKMRYPD